MPNLRRIFHLYRDLNWTAERIARQYPRWFRNPWDVYALLKKHNVTKAEPTNAVAARNVRRERLHAKQVSTIRIPPLHVGTVLLRCPECRALSQTSRCPHCLHLINPIIETAADRSVRTRSVARG